jgi:hypothetical protein
MKKLLSFIFLSILVTFFFGCQEGTEVKNTSGELDRTVLPIKAPERQTYKELDVRNATAPQRFEVKAPEGAPNVILVLLDDLGFAGTGAVASSPDKFRVDEFQFSYGAGLRYLFNKDQKVNVRVDLGISRNGSTGIYFGIEEAF